MEDSGSTRKKRGGRYRVAGAPNSTSCKSTSYTDGISMHQFPKDPVVRKKWVKFVQRHRADLDESSVTRCTSLCSVHFEESCYQRKMSLDLGEFSNMKKFLVRGAIPTRYSVDPERSDVLSERRKRQVCKAFISDVLSCLRSIFGLFDALLAQALL